MAHSLATSPSTSSGALSLAGILGGGVLLAAFVLEIPAGLNVLRLALFLVGAIAVVVAVHRRQTGASPTVAKVAAIAAVVANASYLLRIVLRPGRGIRSQATTGWSCSMPGSPCG